MTIGVTVRPSNVVDRIRARVRALFRPVSYRAQIVWMRLMWTARLCFLVTGIPVKKEFLVLRCMQDDLTSGWFSEFTTVLGALDHLGKWKEIYAGFEIDYADRGLYYDPSVGLNSWEYYFEAVRFGRPENARIRPVSPLLHEMFANRVEENHVSRRDCSHLIERHVRAKTHIRQKLDAFMQAHFQEAFVIGIHYRGTDKHEEAPRVPYDDVVAAVHAALERAGKVPCKLFLATDEQAFLDFMVGLFPGRLLFRPMFRSADGQPIDVVNEDSNYKKGEDAVMDCLLLSRCDYLIRTPSNLGLCAMFFNPGLPEMLLERRK